jgi:hypothetical protein
MLTKHFRSELFDDSVKCTDGYKIELPRNVIETLNALNLVSNALIASDVRYHVYVNF